MLVLELDNEDEFEKVDEEEEEERDVITVRELFARSIIFKEKMKKVKQCSRWSRSVPQCS